MVKHTQTIRRHIARRLNVFDHFVWLALKRLRRMLPESRSYSEPYQISKMERFAKIVNGL